MRIPAAAQSLRGVGCNAVPAGPLRALLLTPEPYHVLQCHGHGSGQARITHQPQDPLLSLAWHYDIRAIDEDLYLAVLAYRRSQNAATDSDLSGTAPRP
jgi:hypothetical protein